MPSATPTNLDSIERLIGAMPLADTLRLIGRIVDHEKFADCDYGLTSRLDDTLAALLDRCDDIVIPTLEPVTAIARMPDPAAWGAAPEREAA